MENKKDKQIVDAIMVSTIMDNIQKYILGTKKNGEPRAMYDIIKDYTLPKKKKNKKKNKYNDDVPSNTYELYLSTKKKRKHKGKKKHWHI